MSKLDYLKRYMSGPAADAPKAKKKKTHRSSAPALGSGITMRDMSEVLPDAGENDGLLEDAPMVVDREQHERAEAEALAAAPKQATSGGSWMIDATGDVPQAPLRLRNRPPPKTVPTAAKKGPSRGQFSARQDSDGDLSPPRGRATARQDSDGDLSPPRGRATARQDSDGDLSPPRGRAIARQDSDGDLSPPRGRATARQDSDGDLSPPRDRAAANSPQREEKKVLKMSSGLTAGVMKPDEIRRQTEEAKRRHREQLDSTADELTGKGAETIYRDKSGKKISEELHKKLNDKHRLKKKRRAEKPQELEWGGGMKQKVDAEQEKDELYQLSQQPFARYDIDKGLDEELKEKRHWNDPLAAAMEEAEILAAAAATKKKKDKKDKKDKNEKMSEQDKENKFENDGKEPELGPQAFKKPKCPHPMPPNRFNIQPGYRWDGKIRGNNYEERWFGARNVKAFYDQEAYKEHHAHM